MLLEVDFEGAHGDADPNYVRESTKLQKLTAAEKRRILKEIKAAGSFLEKHETAKIIVCIDTHCLEENGLLVYSDTDADNLGACDLKTVSDIRARDHRAIPIPCAPSQVLLDCIPKRVYQYLSNGREAPEHAHKSIILNLACGATIGAGQSRSKIFKEYDGSHSASSICSHMLADTVQMRSSPSQMRSPWWLVFQPHFWTSHQPGSSQTQITTSSLPKHSHPAGALSTGLYSHCPNQWNIGYTQELISWSLEGAVSSVIEGVVVTILILPQSHLRGSRSRAVSVAPHAKLGQQLWTDGRTWGGRKFTRQRSLQSVLRRIGPPQGRERKRPIWWMLVELGVEWQRLTCHKQREAG